MGALTVYQYPIGGSVSTRVSANAGGIVGDQGDEWLLDEIPLSTSVGLVVGFEVVVGFPGLSNIAIDDISISNGSCPGR